MVVAANLQPYVNAKQTLVLPCARVQCRVLAPAISVKPKKGWQRLIVLQANGAIEPTLIKTKPRVDRNRVLVTGGAGFVGSHLCTYLVERGDHVSHP